MKEKLTTILSHEMTKLKKGDHKTFEKVVKLYCAKLFAVAARIVGKEEAEDVVQEVFLQFYKKVESFREEAQLGTFLIKMTINRCLNEQKKLERKWSFEKQTSLSLEVCYQNYEEQELLEKALQTLSIEHKTVIVLRLIEGYSTKEVAEMLDLPLGTVLSRLARAQENLKKTLSTKKKEHG